MHKQKRFSHMSIQAIVHFRARSLHSKSKTERHSPCLYQNFFSLKFMCSLFSLLCSMCRQIQSYKRSISRASHVQFWCSVFPSVFNNQRSHTLSHSVPPLWVCAKRGLKSLSLSARLVSALCRLSTVVFNILMVLSNTRFSNFRILN